MDLHSRSEENQFDSLLYNGNHDVGLFSLPDCCPEVLVEEQKIYTPNTKKKGRPKGLKKAKCKSEPKE
jgi:hypothetical protein